MRKICVVVSLFCFISFLGAQETDWFMGKPIADITFQGLSRVKKADLESLITPFLGKTFNEVLLSDLKRRLYALEQFDYVEESFVASPSDAQKLIVRFKVIERPQIGEIVFKGNVNNRSAELLSEITLKVGQAVSKAIAASDEAALLKFYLKNGFSKARVSFAVENDEKDPSLQRLVFAIDEGFKASVRKISFEGIQFGNETTLKGLMKTNEQALFSAGLYQAEVLELDREGLLRYYRENGYIDAKIVDIRVDTESSNDDKRDYLSLVISIEEGRRWYYGGLTIVGNQIFTTDELLALTRLKPGSILNFIRFQADYQAITDKYYKNGYINNEMRLVNENRDESSSTISFTISIIEKGRAYLENIIVRGNTKTKSDVILREIPIEPGDVFSSSRISEGFLNLTNKRFFSNIVPETPAGSAPGLYDLIINVAEQNTTDVRLGFTISGSSDFPLAGIFKWSDTNFLGLGQEFSLDLSVAEQEQRVSFSYVDPWLFGPRWSGGLSLGFSRNLVKNVLQDMVAPFFDSSDDRVPDPYTGAYVFSKLTTYNGLDYAAGDPFPGNPSAADILLYSLQTDYIYNGGAQGIPSEYTMEYVNWDISLGLNSSIRRRIDPGWVFFGFGLSFSLNLVEYDEQKYRPLAPETRANLNQFKFENRLGFTAGLDARDIVFDPANGYFVEQKINLTGGLLLGDRHFIRTDTNLQAYITLWNAPTGDDTSFKTVLALNSSLSVLFPQFWAAEGQDTFQVGKNFLYTSPMIIGRGWPSRTNGQALFNNWIELRTPIVPQLLSFDIFFDIVRLTESRDTIFSAGSQGWIFGFGAGLRLTIPSLPLRLYLGKRFDFDNDGNIQWQKGNIGAVDSDPTSGLDLMITFSFF